MTPTTLKYVTSWYGKVQKRQIKNGVTFALTLDEFIGLFSKKQIRDLDNWHEQGVIRLRMNARWKYAYVCAWRCGKTKRQTNRMDVTSAIITTRENAKRLGKIQKGEKQTAEAKEKIRQARLGKKHSAETCDKISESLTGFKRGPMSQEHKDKIAAAIRAKAELKRNAK